MVVFATSRFMGYLFAGAYRFCAPRVTPTIKEIHRMSASAFVEAESFVDRRGPVELADQPLFERRQFANKKLVIAITVANGALSAKAVSAFERNRQFKATCSPTLPPAMKPKNVVN